jgi:hypothetical protein
MNWKNYWHSPYTGFCRTVFTKHSSKRHARGPDLLRVLFKIVRGDCCICEVRYNDATVPLRGNDNDSNAGGSIHSRDDCNIHPFALKALPQLFAKSIRSQSANKLHRIPQSRDSDSLIRTLTPWCV